MKKVYFLLIIISIYSCSQKTKKDFYAEGISELRMVFEPGLKVGNQQVAKTFQPSYVVTSEGTLLVFCQGRLKEGGDNDPKVILMNKSYDLGKTWEGVEVLSSPMNFFAISPYTTVVDDQETISFLTCVGLKVTKAFYSNDLERVKEATGININDIGEDKAAVLTKYTSMDDGKSWSMEYFTKDATPLYKNYKGFTPVFLNTIGQVHKISAGLNKGRLIIAAPIYAVAKGEVMTDNFRNHKCAGSGIIYSDDQGETWQMDGMITDYLGNEASAVSINDGKELLMIRRMNNPGRYAEFNITDIVDPGNGQRIAHRSSDGGATWSDPFLLNISEVACHGTLARVNNRLYFSIPTGLEDYDQVKENWDDDRIRGSIFYSDDEGVSWKASVVEESYFSYSTVGKLGNTQMITFFSRGGHGRFGIGYRIFTDEWLENNAKHQL